MTYEEHGPEYYEFHPINTNHLILDFTGCKTWWDIQEYIRVQFGFPQYYGQNLSALRDCIDIYSDDIMLVEIKGIHSLPKEAKEEALEILGLFDDIHKSYPNLKFVVKD